MGKAELQLLRHSEMHTITPGTVVNGTYLIGECIGLGSSSKVYRCYKSGDEGRPLAAKILDSSCLDDPGMIKRFQREIGSAQRVRSDKVVKPMDCLFDADILGYVMEYLGGGDLSQRLQHGGLRSYDDILKILHQIASGLRDIHAVNIVHRDLKPENVLFSDSGIAKIADFGIAKMPTTEALTKQGMVLGSIHFVSPEYLTHNIVDSRGDIYALGMIAYEMLLGVIPFAELSPIEALTHRVSTDPTPPNQVRNDCPVGLNDITVKALARNPEDRFQTANELVEAIERASGGHLSSVQTQRRERASTVYTSSVERKALTEKALEEVSQSLVQNPRVSQQAPRVSLIMTVAACLSLFGSVLTLAVMAEVVFFRNPGRLASDSPLESGKSAPIVVRVERPSDNSQATEVASTPRLARLRDAAVGALVLDTQAKLAQAADAERGDLSHYRVKEGDTIWALSREYRVPIDNIISKNSVSDPRQLEIGTVLTLK